MSIRHIHRATLQTWLTSQASLIDNRPAEDQELALLDLRSVEEFAKGHPFFGTNLPVAWLERDVSRFVPRKSVRLVLVDGGDNAASAAAKLLDHFGYTDVNILAGGTPAWNADTANGLPTFDVPGIIYSQGIRDLRKTPSIDAETLKRHFDAKDNVVVIDTRTPAEFARAHVPHAVNLPGEEILYRFLDVVPDPKTHVIVSCAGLPRAIIGAQTLIDAGVTNPVSYLEDGTAGWTRASFALAEGVVQHRPVSEPSRRFAEERANALLKRENVPVASQDSVASWLADSTNRSTYLLDVRSAEEYAASHAPAAISAPGGQLLAVSHRTLATRGARLVLVDDDGTRAITTAYWLRQRGWEVHLLKGATGTAKHTSRVEEPVAAL